MSASPERDSQRVSYWSIVWAELSRNRVAMAGLVAVLGFFLLAIYAPIISFDQPLLWVGEDGVRCPWFAALFNRLLFENAVDIFFNLAMVLSPLFVAVWWGLGRWGEPMLPRRNGNDFLRAARCVRTSGILFVLEQR